MKVIFLDFDGVINTPKTWGKRPADKAIERALVMNVALLAEEYDARVVISSTWRKLFRLDELQFWLAKNGLLADRVIGITPILSGYPRSAEINLWLEGRDVDQFVILDDDPSANIAGHFVRCNDQVGFEASLLPAARAILEGKLR